MNWAFINPSLVLATTLLSLASPASAQTTEADFTRQMAERFRAALPGHTIDISAPLQFRIGREGDPSEVNVGRIYSFCETNTAEECEGSIAAFVAGIVDTINNIEAPVTREQLRLVVRSTDYCDQIEQTFPQDQPRPLIRPVVAGLCAMLMFDFPTRMQTASADDLGKLELDSDAAWALAGRQTFAGLPKPEELKGLRKDVVLVAGMENPPSLMLNEEGWRRGSARYGELIVAVPDGDAMVVVRRATMPDLNRLKTTVREHFNSAQRAISPTLYRWTAEGWVPFE